MQLEAPSRQVIWALLKGTRQTRCGLADGCFSNHNPTAQVPDQTSKRDQRLGSSVRCLQTILGSRSGLPLGYNQWVVWSPERYVVNVRHLLLVKSKHGESQTGRTSNMAHRVSLASVISVAILCRYNDVGIFPSDMAYTFSQSCQLPSLSVWHTLRPHTSDALFHNNTSQRNSKGTQHQRRLLSSHAMSCRAASVGSRGDRLHCFPATCKAPSD